MRLVVLKFIQGTENRNTCKMITQLELVDDSVNIKIEAKETVKYFFCGVVSVYAVHTLYAM